MSNAAATDAMADAPDEAALLAELLPRLHRLAVHLVGARDAEDGLQEALAEIHRSLPDFRGDAAAATFCHRIAVRTLVRWRQRRVAAQARERLAAVEPDALADAGDGPFTVVARAEQRRRVHDALARLPAPYRDVLVLRSLEGLSYQEIAHVLEVPLGTVKSRIAAASALLAERLRPLEES